MQFDTLNFFFSFELELMDGVLLVYLPFIDRKVVIEFRIGVDQKDVEI